MNAPTWLTARPVAHRGLHVASAGRIENTLSAIGAAADHGFAIEIDVHLSADGQVFVHHDRSLGRLTLGEGDTGGMTLEALQAVPFKATDDRIPRLADVLALVAGRVPLFVEVKSRFGARQRSLIEAVAAALADYAGPAAVMSFDPRMVEDFGTLIPDRPRGIIADDAADPADYGDFTAEQRAELASLAHLDRTRPQFVAYWVKLLPNDVGRRVRDSGLPLLTWTVRSAKDRAAAAAHADQMIFENFDPEA